MSYINMHDIVNILYLTIPVHAWIVEGLCTRCEKFGDPVRPLGPACLWHHSNHSADRRCATWFPVCPGTPASIILHPNLTIH